MESTTTTKRSSSRCREWERQRRIKFNDAITKLGELVKSINKANSSGDANDNVQYPKIEIVQKAIICLTNCAQEKTELKAKILSLEVKLEAIESQKHNKRDVCLQVTLGVNKRSQNSKYVKLLMLQKDKQSTTKEKIIKASPKSKIEKKIQPAPIDNKVPSNLPKLLPIPNVKKENTFVMLPAAPYIFPQRSVLFPTMPPTIVLVDANVPAINKQTPVPIISRTNDITKTTMVNILPISAYSRPLSASKSKKTNKKSGTTSKATKKSKIDEKKSEEEQKSAAETIPDKTDTSKEIPESSKKASDVVEKSLPNDEVKNNKNENIDNTNNINIDKSEAVNSKTDSNIEDKIPTDKVVEEKVSCNTENTNLQNSKTAVEKEKSLDIQNTSLAVEKPQVLEKPPDPVTTVEVEKCNKIAISNSSEKPSSCEVSNKEKIPNILDTAICESVVDGGNARLELAEEFLAASPTAAFLMSFPLVSGNRADSPAEEPQSAVSTTVSKENNQQSEQTTRASTYFEKSNSMPSKSKTNIKPQNPTNSTAKNIDQEKYQAINKQLIPKTTVTSAPNICNENPFLNLPIPAIVTTNSTLPESSSFGLDFDCSVNKPITTQTSSTTNYSNSNNIFYKSDSFSTAKSTIYSTSSISSGHEFNSIGLYPCAVDNYSNKNKPDFNTDENLMKINSSRLTYDIDLGWSHKGFDFVNCSTTAGTFHKDNILTTAATPYSTTYNPFNPDFHVPLVPNVNKKSTSSSKLSTFPDTITSFYSQSSLWSEEIPNIYSHSNVSKNFPMKQQNYVPTEQIQPTINQKVNPPKHYDQKLMTNNTVNENVLKTPAVVGNAAADKFTKKSPSKLHINWMTSEVRPMQNDCIQPQAEIKEPYKLPYPQHDQSLKKQTQVDSNYFPINMHHFPTHPNHDESQVWPTPRPAGTTEISIEPPPINLPTLVGDLALGPHDRKKNELLNRTLPHSELQNCSNFFSVTQLMNRSSDNVAARPNGLALETAKIPNPPKQNTHNVNETNRKGMALRPENNPQLCYVFNDTKTTNTFDNMTQFTHQKNKTSKQDKNSKIQKNNYSAESLIRGGTCSQKHPDSKYIAAQKYNDYNITHETGVAQVSHFPPIIDYSENNFAGQQFSGTTLYNTTTNSISNSFYSNFMPSGSNLMTSNYTGGPFTSDFVDYNQTSECNYANHKYDPKMRNTAPTYQQDKEAVTYKSTRRESAAKHKLECTKKETNSKKYQSKRAKINNEVEEWNDPSHLMWQNKNTSKRHPNLMTDEPTFPNYVGNQMSAQYQPEYFNSHLVASNMQNIGPNGDRSLSNFPVTSRANFNLSALFPEITTKVQ